MEEAGDGGILPAFRMMGMQMHAAFFRNFVALSILM